MERMLLIHEAMVANRFPNHQKLALELNVSSKTVQRDMEFMRDRLGLPVEYNPERWGYYYSEPVTSFPALQISEGEFFALLLAEKSLQQYRGTNFEEPLLNAFRKLAAALPETISINLANWEKSISFRTSAEPALNLGIFQKLAEAASSWQQLAITYRKPGRAPENRVINPYHLANINGEWFLFAYDHLRKALRTFVPARIEHLHKTGKTFARPESFSVEKNLRDSFGVHSAQGEYEVVIRFDSSVAPFIKEKKWHHSQELKPLSGGGVEVKFKLSSLMEVQRWILSWGAAAKVVKPAELAKALRESLRKTLAQYR